MLEINVYLIFDSKVFGVKIGINFPFAIVKKLQNCKYDVIGQYGWRK
jgi:hypothetical protein